MPCVKWVACAGIAFGALLAEATGGRWGEGFAHFANMDPKLGSFAVATTFFLASTLLIGYGGGLALPYRPDLSWTESWPRRATRVGERLPDRRWAFCG